MLQHIKELEKGFFDTLTVLRDVLPQMVVVGGWCPYIYALHLWKKPIPEIPTTTDIDLGVLETGNTRYEKTVYDRLKSAGFGLERIYDEEETPIEFIYKKKDLKLKIEFITSFETSDDTLNRFLGSGLACNRIEAFELLLRETESIPLKAGKAIINLAVPTPEMFLYHKGITFVMRSAEFKRNKDLFYLYFILRFHPDREKILDALKRFKQDDYFQAFKENIKEYLSDISSPGYLILRPFLQSSIAESEINADIKETFSSVLKLF